ncbi:MAG TPA: hypothetical protein DCP40_09640 [Stenotrophomonas sp.]|nr:hypothetical protein [Stenotrophomonas sp.]
MSNLSPQTEALIERFRQSSETDSQSIDNLRSALERSPPLAQRLDEAIAAGHVRSFALLPSTVNAGGTYDGENKVINLAPSILASRGSDFSHDPYELTFVLGHEIEHGFNHADKMTAYSTFETSLGFAASGVRDYTAPISAMLNENRKDEAKANIGGWNALAGRVNDENPEASLVDMYRANRRAQDFIEHRSPPSVYVAKSNMEVNDDLSISITQRNIEGMAQNYFDKPGTQSRLGHHANSDYFNYYGAYLIERAIHHDRQHPHLNDSRRMTINMGAVGLSERQLEENGINLGTASATPYPYSDSSSSPPTLHHFDHTNSTFVHVPIAVREAMPAEGHLRQVLCQPQPDSLVVPIEDRALHQQIREKVAELDAEHGRSFDASSERLSASLLVLARENGLDRVDHVVLSQQTSTAPAAHGIFVVKGQLDDPAALRASIATAAAAQRPVHESMERLVQVNQREAEGASQDRTHEQAQEQQRGALAR